MILHQALAIEKMIAPCIGDCKCFNKLDQSRIDLRRGGGLVSAVGQFFRPGLFHPSRMLRAANRWQAVYMPIAKSDTIEEEKERDTEQRKFRLQVIGLTPPIARLKQGFDSPTERKILQ